MTVEEEAVVEVDELLSSCSGGMEFKLVFAALSDFWEEIDVDRRGCKSY